MSLAISPPSNPGSPLNGFSSKSSPASVPSTPSFAGFSATAAPSNGGAGTYADYVKSWDDEQVARWLAEANVGQQYVALFKQNDINGNVLLDVDQQALKEMGIRSVGDRVKITVAIKALRQKCAQSARAASLADQQNNPVSFMLPATARRAPGTKPTGRVPPPLLLPRSNSTELPQAWQPGPRMPATGPRPKHLSPNGTMSNPTSPLLGSSNASSPRTLPSMPPPRSQPPPTPSHSGSSPTRSAAPAISTTAASPTTPLGWRAPVIANGANITRSASTSARNPSYSRQSSMPQHRKTSSSSASIARPSFASYPNQPLSAHPYAATASSSSASATNGDATIRGTKSLLPSPLVAAPSSSTPTQRPTTPTIIATSSSGSNLDAIMRKAVKFVSADDGTTKTIVVDDCTNGREVLLRVLRKFGKLQDSLADDELDNWVVCLSESDHQLRILSEDELFSVCRDATTAERQRGLIVRRVSPSPEATLSSKRARKLQWMFGEANTDNGGTMVPATRIEPASPSASSPGSSIGYDTERHGSDSPPQSISSTKKKKRASTVSVMSGLGADCPSTSAAPTNASTASPTANAVLASGRKLRNFFGQRPPSELIATHLTEYFPRAERNKFLSKQVRQSMRRSMVRRDSYAYAPDNATSLLSVASSGSTSEGGTRPSMESARSSVRSLLEPPDEEAEAEEGGGGVGGDDDSLSVRPSNPRRLSASSRISGLSAWEKRRSQKANSDAASMITVDEVTAELETRRYSSSEEATTDFDDDFDSTTDSDDDHDEDADTDSDEPVIATIQKPALKWIKGALIGSGSFGSVFLGMNPSSGSLMAVKQVELPTGTSHNEERKKSMVDALEREIELLKTLQHENIVQYLDSSTDATHLNIFLEYVPGGSVAALLSNYGAFEEALVSKFVRQILTGLAYLHEREIVHRDIKGANILVDNKGGIKISDFGISKKVEDNWTSHRPSLQGSVYWMAPEVVKQTAYSSKADIWSLGCLVVEMLTGEHPWANLTQMQAIFRIGSSSTPAIPDDISSEAEDFLKKTFCIDHNERPSASDLLSHPFIVTASTGTGNDGGAQQTPTRATFNGGTS